MRGNISMNGASLGGALTKAISLMGRLVVRWLECLGENPPLSRDHGIHAWRYLHPPRRRRPTLPRPAAMSLPVRHLRLVPAESPGPDRDRLLPLLSEGADGSFSRQSDRFSPSHAP